MKNIGELSVADPTEEVMKIAYYTTIPPPPIAGTESVSNDIGILMKYFDGEYLNLYPFKSPHPRIPWHVVGLNRYREIKQMDGKVDVHHIFSSRLSPFPILRILHKPIVYTVTSAVIPIKDKPVSPSMHIVVESERDLTVAKKNGFENCSMVTHGIDCSRILKNPLILQDEVTLLTASAPWISHQFKEKGFDLLFETVSQRNDLRLVILMRGHLIDELKKRLKLFSVEDRVNLIDTYIDINLIFPRIHGTIVMAEKPGIIRAYPHSLIESLAAGKPVIVSDIIPMADYVKKKDVGCVVKDHSLSSLNNAINDFIDRYDTLRMNAEMVGGRDFSMETMIAEYKEVYEKIQGSRVC
jgi:glycosyltransferase involved in cell wall biosynthesis